MAINSTIRRLANLGERLIAERNRLNWSREDMANFGGVSRASQRLYDASDRVPTLTYLLQLARAGADFNYLLTGDKIQTDSADRFNVPKVAIAKSYRLVRHMAQSENSRVSTEDDEEELLLSLLEQVHLADSPEMDLDAIAAATSTDPSQ